MPRPRSKNKRHYFTQVHEDAIVAYTKTDDIDVRTELYVLYIGPAFNEMVDKIIYTYKFTTLPNIDVLKDECKVWLTTILDKYDQSKGSKAFSYFSVITKNWFIHKVKKHSKDLKKEVRWDDVSGELEQGQLSVEHGYVTFREDKEFWIHLWGEINSWESLKLKDNENKPTIIKFVL